MNVYLDLFVTFAKIAFSSFGGLSMIQLILSEMVGHGWLTAQEVMDIIAIAEITPGPNGLNCATFTGLKVGGFLGAVIANFGCCLPTFTLFAIAMVFLKQFKDSMVLKRLLSGIRPASIGIIASAAISLALLTFWSSEGTFIPLSVLIAGVCALALGKFKAPLPLALLIGAVLGGLSTLL